jgi:5-methylcytosine-specific restriction protein B
VWFPEQEGGSLIGFVVGTRGLSPDEDLLTRPGHQRRVAALRRYLTDLGVEAWSKADPAALDVSVPQAITRQAAFQQYAPVFRRYGTELYCVAAVPADSHHARRVVAAFFDLYAWERDWHVLAQHKSEFEAFISGLRASVFPATSADSVVDLLHQRRFVVLQGPPGTGKTRMAEQVKRDGFGGRGMTVQFHPAVTYEDFVVGLSPRPTGDSLRFDVRPGWLIRAAREASDGDYLLVVDEINRADLGNVLGEAIYLFEANEIGGDHGRRIELPHAINGDASFALPQHLYVLATMNTADRSIASLDLAVRRRFAFVSMFPDRSVVAAQGLEDATQAFDRLMDVFVEHAPNDALDLMPGHAYFLANDAGELRSTFRHGLLPLLDEYLREGYLGSATFELHAVRGMIDNLSH